ncbi:MAG: sugar phosphate isomerase/epimerase family protein [Planctomycetota bacterium]
MATTTSLRPVTLFTGQWADLTLDTMAAKARSFGYDGLELACWGDHFSPTTALSDPAYCKGRHDLLAKHNLKTWAISTHLVGQAVCDNIDARHKLILPPEVWGDGEPEGVRRRAADEMKATARAAAKLGVKVVNGFTGSSIWGMFYFFPPTSKDDVKRGFDDFAKRWGPILDVFKAEGVKFALEVHPGEIAYDYYSTETALSAIGNHPAFGLNFDPSHLLWQGVSPHAFIDRFADRIFHCHMKDVSVYYGQKDGKTGVLGSHLAFGDARRGWDFRSVGRGHVNFEEIMRSLNRAAYTGPLSVEWEDPDMEREHGAKESCEFVRRLQFKPSNVAFDAAFEKK